MKKNNHMNIYISIFIIFLLPCFIYSQEYHKDKIIVNFDSKKNAENFQKTKEYLEFIKKYDIKKFHQYYKGVHKYNHRHSKKLAGIYFIEFNGNLNKVIKYFEKNPIISSVRKVEINLPLNEPNDYGIQGGVLVQQTYLDLIQAKNAWNITEGNSEIVIAISEKYGFDASHEELTNKIVGYTSQDVLTTSNKHGNGVAGIAAAETNNSIGISSIGYNCSLSLYFSGMDEVFKAAEEGADIINCSWIYRNYVQDDQDCIELIYDVFDAVIVAGAGNGPNGVHCGDGHGYCYPASYDNVISVSSVGHIYEYGTDDPNYGQLNWIDVHEQIIGTDEMHTHNDKVSLVAPGYNLYTLENNNEYKSQWGTSFASPLTAGTCALIRSINPCLSAYEIKNIVISSTDDIYNLEANQSYIGLLGSGRLNAFNAVKKAYYLSCIISENIQEDKYRSKLCLENVNCIGNEVNFFSVNGVEIFGGFEIANGTSVNFNSTSIDEINCN